MVKPFCIGDERPDRKRKRSQKQEKRLAKKVGGRVQPGSGSTWGSKGDVKTKGHFVEDDLAFLYECKYTDGKGFRVTVDLWKEISDKAFFEGKRPALQLEIKDLHLVVIEEDDWLSILDMLKTKKEGLDKME